MSSNSEYFCISKAAKDGDFHLGVEIASDGWFLVILERTIDPRYQVSARFTPEEVSRSPRRLQVFQHRHVDWLITLIKEQGAGSAVDRNKVVDELAKRRLYHPLDSILELGGD